jgi:hypothetical protein
MLVGDVNVENAGNKMMSRVKNVRKEYTVKKLGNWIKVLANIEMIINLHNSSALWLIFLKIVFQLV